MATYIGLSPGPNDVNVPPQLPQFNWLAIGNQGFAFIPVYPLPSSFGSGAFAMSLAPLVLPFLALLSWWFK